MSRTNEELLESLLKSVEKLETLVGTLYDEEGTTFRLETTQKRSTVIARIVYTTSKGVEGVAFERRLGRYYHSLEKLRIFLDGWAFGYIKGYI